MPESHAPENNRKYEGESAASALINWLNFTEDEAGRARILAVINAFFVTLRLAVSTPLKLKYDRKGHAWAEETPDQMRFDEACEHLDTLFGYYTLVPYVIIGQYELGQTDGPRRVSDYIVGWKTSPGSAMESHQNSVPSPDSGRKWKPYYELPGAQMGEIGALLNAVELIKLHLIFKIGRCRCDKFYFKKFAHQRFCSGKCRVAESRDSDEARAKRAAYSRKLYHLHKTGKVK
jgi:hypothetical protein